MKSVRSGSGSFWGEQHMYYGRCISEYEKSVLVAHRLNFRWFLDITTADFYFFGIKVEGVDGKRIQVVKRTLNRMSREALEAHTGIWLKLWTIYGVCQFSMASFKVDFQFCMSNGLTSAIRRPTRRTFSILSASIFDTFLYSRLLFQIC